MQTWIIAAGEGPIRTLVALARPMGGAVTILAVGPADVRDAAAAAGADRVLHVPTGSDANAAAAAGAYQAPTEANAEANAGPAAEAYTAGVAAAAREARPGVVLCPDSPAERVLAAAVAAAIGAAWVPGIRSLRAAGTGVAISRVAVEGRVIEDLTATGPVVGIFDGPDDAGTAGSGTAVGSAGTAGSGTAGSGTAVGASAAEQTEASADGSSGGDASGEAAPVTVLDLVPDAGLRRVGPAPAAGGDADDARALATAPRVVGIGRGVRSSDEFALVERLAAAIGADRACTLPVAEDLGRLSLDRVVGRTGRVIKPQLYLAVGISGQPQHVDGIRDARIVAAIDADPDAPIFRRAQYGIIGDVADVVPALLAELETR